MNGNNYSFDINKTLPDGGVWTDVPLPVLGARTSAGLVLAGSGTTTPYVEISSGLGRIGWAATVVNATVIEGIVPGSLATKYRSGTVSKPSAGFKIECLVSQVAVSTPDTVTFSIRPYAISDAGVAKAWAAVTKAIPSTTGNVRTTLLEWDFTNVADANGYYLEPGDKLYIEAKPGAHANDTIFLYDARLRLTLNPALTNSALRT